jgi:hypothetical protein
MNAEIHVQEMMRLLGRDWPVGFHDHWYMTRSGCFTPDAEESCLTAPLAAAE